ncbi:hypothetical protein CC1G_13245 [Coprinopsis cinerea okayama7|uniref:Uncharacterized protein n=1 Tax=Coprinopsis cinerea (strain Okayama-7 / 130 / ATCC MYA-4618 / FGSC 9003) TaxID=240176 RepID=A8PI42_COPC7|nr:hypothetical protein CC1G_13245 [Coprinopsis cinerea okayama7\|eukprot:XP_001841513.2 hypothetical protein CC1G_13245 [Coprinopsis cinerea okayama7\
MTQIAREIHGQAGRHGKVLKRLHPNDPSVIHVLCVAPGHIVPLASGGSDCFAIGSDLMNVSGKCEYDIPFFITLTMVLVPDVVRDEKNWLDHIDRLSALLLAIMCCYDKELAEAVERRATVQKQQIDALYAAVGEALGTS